jgi:putative oxidoreductase
MKAETLIRALLIGRPDAAPFAILVARVCVGVFFAISGGNKLLVARHTQEMFATLSGAGIPFPHVMTYVVSSVEFIGGCLLIIGLLTSLTAAALTLVMIAAIYTVQLAALPKSPSFLDWLDNFLYLPEVLYIVIFFSLICSGPGRFSIDRLIARGPERDDGWRP